MENITSGASANTVEEPVTAANSRTSPSNGKRSTKKTNKPITPAEAAELLTSALSYCLESGLNVIGYNENGLVLFIDGLEYGNDKIQVRNVINVTPVTVE